MLAHSTPSRLPGKRAINPVTVIDKNPRTGTDCRMSSAGRIIRPCDAVFRGGISDSKREQERESERYPHSQSSVPHSTGCFEYRSRFRETDFHRNESVIPWPKWRIVQSKPEDTSRTTRSTQEKVRLISAVPSCVAVDFNGNPKYFKPNQKEQPVSCDSFKTFLMTERARSGRCAPCASLSASTKISRDADDWGARLNLIVRGPRASQ